MRLWQNRGMVRMEQLAIKGRRAHLRSGRFVMCFRSPRRVRRGQRLRDVPAGLRRVMEQLVTDGRGVGRATRRRMLPLLDDVQLIERGAGHRDVANDAHRKLRAEAFRSVSRAPVREKTRGLGQPLGDGW